MWHSDVEKYENISDSRQKQIFYNDSTLRLIKSLTRGFTSQPFSYLFSLIEINNVLLELLETYCTSRHLFIKKQRRRKNQSAEELNEGQEREEENEENQIIVKEFDFERFELEYGNEGMIKSYFKALKMCGKNKKFIESCVVSLFNRIIKKPVLVPLFFKVSTLNQILGLMTSHNPEIVEFAGRIASQFFEKLEKNPLLFVDVFFSKNYADCQRISGGINQYEEEVTYESEDDGNFEEWIQQTVKEISEKPPVKKIKTKRKKKKESENILELIEKDEKLDSVEEEPQTKISFSDLRKLRKEKFERENAEKENAEKENAKSESTQHITDEIQSEIEV